MIDLAIYRWCFRVVSYCFFYSSVEPTLGLTYVSPEDVVPAIMMSISHPHLTVTG